jgi:YVTN family beta-propeller protein
MRNFIITILLGILISFSQILPGFGTELPKQIIDFIKIKFPEANIRFDGLIELPDGTKYLPVLPINYEYANDSAEIIITIPANTDLTKRPDLILFANNLSLLKMIKKSDGTYTLISSPQIPLRVKLGLLPQDLVVPENLVIPPELRVITGDLKIKVNDDASKIIVNTQNNKSIIKNTDISYSTGKVNNLSNPELQDLVDKTLYSTNFQTSLIYVIFPKTGKPMKTIELTSIPSDIAITNDNRYVLVTGFSSNQVSIIDTINNSFITDINVGKLPIAIALSEDSELAYIANKLSSSISILDIKNMLVRQELSVIGTPSCIIASEDEDVVFYSDSASGKIYKLQIPDFKNSANRKTESEITLLTQVSNISKIAKAGNYLFILSRSNNTMIIYDVLENKVVKTLDVGKKPVDLDVLKEKNKLYVLSAESYSIDVVDLSTLSITNTVTLKNSGFPKNMNIMKLTNKALISNTDSYEIAVIDLDKEKVIDYLPVGTTINSLIIMQNSKE